MILLEATAAPDALLLCRLFVSRALATLFALTMLGSIACASTAVSGVRETSIDLNDLNKSAPPVDESRRKKQLQQYRKYLD